MRAAPEREGAGPMPRLAVAEGLSLAAAPTFAAMALLTGLLGGDPAMQICSGGGASPFSGMAAMYALMSIFHLSPWLRLIARKTGAVRR